MKLSIIIPFHQGSIYLEDCLESIVEQQLSDYEVILVLDHVNEDITSLLESYKTKLPIVPITLQGKINLNSKIDQRIQAEMHLNHSGVAVARNKGLEMASGEYIYFLDSDDYLLSGTLPLLLKETDKQKPDLVYGDYEYTWFKRKVFLSSIEKKNSTEASDMEENQIDVHKEQMISLYKQIISEHLKESRDTSVAKAYYDLFAGKRSFANISALHILIRHDFIQNDQTFFEEDYRFFSDFVFVAKLLRNVTSCVYVKDAIYVKRKHNDPIHYPALCQARFETTYEELIAAYKRAKAEIRETAMQFLLDDKLVRLYVNTFTLKMRRSEESRLKGQYFREMSELLRAIPVENVILSSGYEKRIFKAAKKGNVKKALFYINLHLGKRKLLKIRKNKRVFAYYLYFKFFSKMSIKENWVICESFFGKSYSDSPKYIYEYLCKNYPGKYKFIWVVNSRTKIPFHPTKVKRFSIRYCYYLARCKYNVFNVRQPEWMRKREGNVFLETWHGTPLKKLVFDQEEVCGASPLYKAQFYKQSRLWDYLVSANHFSTECFKSAFLFDQPILEYGYPRNDILYSERKEELITQLKAKLKIPANKKTILYAPTWRDDEYYGRGQYKFELKLDLHLLKKLLGEEYVVLLRTHYFIADQLDVAGLEDFAINVSKYDDISELYLVSDLLITDYSSVFFDYANLKRPILFYTYDLEKYRDMLRGFYLDIEKDVPGPLLFTTGEVATAIKELDQITEEYRERYEVFYQKFCSLEDGHASENIAKKVFNLK